MSSGFITLADVAARTDTLAVACSRCDRTGQYRLDVLIKRYALGFAVPGLLRQLSASCPRRAEGFCCKVSVLVESDHCEAQFTSQAATWNSPAMNFVWALMSLPPMFRTCPFLIIAIAS